MDFQDIANALSHSFAPGGVTVSGILLLGYIALIKGWLRIPDKTVVSREMYEAKVKEAAEWKEIAIPSAATIKEQADQLSKLTDVLETFSRSRVGSRR